MQLKPYCPYLVGDVYITLNAGNPASVWAGTEWEALPDRVLLGAGSTHAAGTTGGESSHTLTVDEIPSHKHQVPAHGHGFTQPTVPALNHGLNGHTHTYAKPNSPTGGTAVTVAQLASHNHVVEATTTDKEAGGYGLTQTGGFQNRVVIYRDAGSIPVKNTGSGSTHTHTVGTTSTNTGVFDSLSF